MLSTGSYYLCHVKANSLIQVTELTREFLYVEVIRDTHATYQSDLTDSGRSKSARQQVDLNQTPDAVDASQASQSSKESQSQGITSINAVQTIDVNKDSSSSKSNSSSLINIQGQESQKSSGAITRSQTQREFFVDKGMCDPSQVQDDKDHCDDRSDIDPWMIPGTKGFIPQVSLYIKDKSFVVFNAKFRLILNSEEQSKKKKNASQNAHGCAWGKCFSINAFGCFIHWRWSGGTWRESTLSQS